MSDTKQTRPSKFVLIRPNALEAAAMCSSTDSYRPQLNGVYVEPDGTVVATDGHRLLLIPPTDPTGKMALEFPEIPVANGMHKPEKGTIIPNAAIKEVLRSAKGIRKGMARMEVLGHVALTVNDTTAEFVATDLDTTPRTGFKPIDSQFPSYQQVIPPADRPGFSISFNPKLLRETLAAMEKAGAGEMDGVTFRFGEPLQACRIEAANGSCTAVVMPLLGPK